MRKRDGILLAAALITPGFGTSAWGQKGQTGGADECRRKGGHERVRDSGYHRRGNRSPVERRSKHLHLPWAPLGARETLVNAFSGLLKLGLVASVLLVAAEAGLDAWQNRPILHKLTERALAPLRPFA